MEPISTGMLIYAGLRILSQWNRNGTIDRAVDTTGKIIAGTAEAVGEIIEYAGEYIAKVKTLFWSTVNSWMSARRVTTGDVGSLLRERLGNGEYRVVCGVFSSSGSVRQKTAWECSELDNELRSRLTSGDRITIKL